MYLSNPVIKVCKKTITLSAVYPIGNLGASVPVGPPKVISRVGTIALAARTREHDNREEASSGASATDSDGIPGALLQRRIRRKGMRVKIDREDLGIPAIEVMICLCPACRNSGRGASGEQEASRRELDPHIVMIDAAPGAHVQREAEAAIRRGGERIARDDLPRRRDATRAGAGSEKQATALHGPAGAAGSRQGRDADAVAADGAGVEAERGLGGGGGRRDGGAGAGALEDDGGADLLAGAEAAAHVGGGRRGPRRGDAGGVAGDHVRARRLAAHHGAVDEELGVLRARGGLAG